MRTLVLAAIIALFTLTPALAELRSQVIEYEQGGVVTFHGGLYTPTPSDARRIKGSVLALHGADDQVVGHLEVAAFQAEMTRADVDWQLVVYSGARHSFTYKGLKYDRRADLRSWEAMRAFLDEVLEE